MREAICYPLKLRGMNSTEIKQRMARTIDLLHLPEAWLDRSELQLSTGQKQLVAIARGIISEPKILLLDEPTSALDAGTAARLLQVSIELSTNSKTTILMVNHQLELAEQFCTRMLHLEGGKLLADLPAPQIDWQQIRQNIVEAETAAEQEW